MSNNPTFRENKKPRLDCNDLEQPPAFKIPRLERNDSPSTKPFSTVNVTDSTRILFEDEAPNIEQYIPQDEDIWLDIDDNELILASQKIEKQNQSELFSDYEFNNACATSTQLSGQMLSNQCSSSKNIPNYLHNQIKGNLNYNHARDNFKQGETSYAHGKLSSVYEGDAKGQMENLIKELHILRMKNSQLNIEMDTLKEKCTLTEGEVKILRTKLDHTQSQANAAKSRRLQYEEENQLLLNAKILSLQKDNESLKTQIEFKKLDETKLKERCRLLEKDSGKIKSMDQTITPTKKWQSGSNFNQMKQNFKINSKDGSTQTRKVNSKVLHITTKATCYPFSDDIPLLIFSQAPPNNQTKKFCYNEESPYSAHSKCNENQFNFSGESSRSSESIEERLKIEINLDVIHEDILYLMSVPEREIKGSKMAMQCAANILRIAKMYLLKTKLESTRKVTLEAYLDMEHELFYAMENNPNSMIDKNSFDFSPWCENEQAVDARRVLATVAMICKSLPKVSNFIFGIVNFESCGDFNKYKDLIPESVRNKMLEDDNITFVQLLSKMCDQMRLVGRSHMYPGYLTSVCLILKNCAVNMQNSTVCEESFELMKKILILGPNVRVLMEILIILRSLSMNKQFLEKLCETEPKRKTCLDLSNVSLTCFLRLLCVQVERWVSKKNFSNMQSVYHMTVGLLEVLHFSRQISVSWAICKDEKRCRCLSKLFQCTMVCLNKILQLYIESSPSLDDSNLQNDMICLFRAGIIFLYPIRYTFYLGIEFFEFINNLVEIRPSLDLNKEHSTMLDALSMKFPSDGPPLEGHFWEFGFNSLQTSLPFL